jgi:hypothetical protein
MDNVGGADIDNVWMCYPHIIKFCISHIIAAGTKADTKGVESGGANLSSRCKGLMWLGSGNAS